MVTVLAYFSILHEIPAQVTDNFSDGDFTASPPWTGDQSQFIVDNERLRLNGTGTDSSSLVTVFPDSIIPGMEWQFRIKLNFSPSSSNYARYYLYCNSPLPEGPVQGIFLQFGESGSNDAVELYLQDGNTLIFLCRGIDGKVASSFEYCYRVIYDSLNKWTVYSGLTFQSLLEECNAVQPVAFPPGFTGIRCNYTSGNADEFYLDDIYAGDFIPDTIPPYPDSLVIISNSQIQVYLNEPAQLISMQDASNYMLTPGNIVPANINVLPGNSSVQLGFNPGFTNGTVYTLKINDLSDETGNHSGTILYNFRYIEFGTPQKGDVMITEIMANPAGANLLPEAEYVEIYNNSNNYFNTEGWTISDESTSALLPAGILMPGEYKMYCKAMDTSAFIQAGFNNIIGLTALPSLNNDEDAVILTAQILLDRVNYSDTWYQDPLKKNGGWSLEKKDCSFPCPSSENWAASLATAGGTPGKQNSIQVNFADDDPPVILHIEYIDSTHIVLHFNENMDSLSVADITSYTFTGSLNSISCKAIEPEFKTVAIEFDSEIHSGVIYYLNLNGNQKDCAGNKITGNLDIKFGKPSPLEKNDIVINEILFNPYTNGNDFIEIYNNSDKIISTSSLHLTRVNSTTGVADPSMRVQADGKLFFPGDYLALTDDPEAVINFYLAEKDRIIKTALPSMNDDEGTIILLNDSLAECDRVYYNEDFHYPLLTVREGVSLEKIHPSISAMDPSGWHSASAASAFATPGRINSQYSEPGQSPEGFSIYPEYFTPDNDGFSDYCSFKFNEGNSGYSLTLKVYDQQGICRTTLAENEILGATELRTWDGTGAENKLLNPGLYIVFARLIHPKGEVREYKKTCVIYYK